MGKSPEKICFRQDEQNWAITAGRGCCAQPSVTETVFRQTQDHLDVPRVSIVVCDCNKPFVQGNRAGWSPDASDEHFAELGPTGFSIKFSQGCKMVIEPALL